MPSSSSSISVVRIAQPDLARQAEAIIRLLGHAGLETRQPQAVNPEAAPSTAVVGSDRDIVSEQDNGSTHCALST